MTPTRLFKCILVALTLVPFAAPLFADPGSAALEPEVSATAPQGDRSGLCSSSLTATDWKVWTAPTIEAQSTCIAYCWDGTTRTCTGSSCSAYDSACPEEQGRCFGSGTPLTYKKCPSCPEQGSCPSPSCLELDGQPCTKPVTCYAEPDCLSEICGCYGNMFACA